MYVMPQYTLEDGIFKDVGDVRKEKTTTLWVIQFQIGQIVRKS